MAATIDLLPTFARLTGAKLPSNVTIDGIDMSPMLFHNQPVRQYGVIVYGLLMYAFDHQTHNRLSPLVSFCLSIAFFFLSLSVCLSVYLSVCLSVCLSLSLSLIFQSNREYFVYFGDNASKDLGISALRWQQYKIHYNSHG